MERHLDVELKDLKSQILTMGGFVELAVEEATQALIRREPERLARVYDLEARINQSHIRVDENCVSILARQSPMATDLRLILAIIKINTDLERMGDQAVNIAHNSKRYLKGNPVAVLPGLSEMANRVREMVRDSLDAFVKRDAKMARNVILRDDEVDVYKNESIDVLTLQMHQNPKSIEQALNLILIARNLERLGDHATNIAEDVIFMITGQDVRHGGGDGEGSGDRTSR